MSEQENGVQNGARNIGRLALALIPWALAIGASVWLGVYVGIHQFRHELSQEDRAAVYTAATQRQKSKIAIQIIPHDCSTVTRADIDGSTLLLYAQNNCHKRLRYFEWHWQALSPNRTILTSDWTNGECPMPIESSDVAECKMEIEPDDRTTTIRIWTQTEP